MKTLIIPKQNRLSAASTVLVRIMTQKGWMIQIEHCKEEGKITIAKAISQKISETNSRTIKRSIIKSSSSLGGTVFTHNSIEELFNLWCKENKFNEFNLTLASINARR